MRKSESPPLLVLEKRGRAGASKAGARRERTFVLVDNKDKTNEHSEYSRSPVSQVSRWQKFTCPFLFEEAASSDKKLL